MWVPDPTHEALRDLVRARVDASMHLMRARQQLLAFLFRHGRIYGSAGKYWTQRHRSWLAGQTFELHAHQIVFQDYVEAVWTAQERRDALIEKITEMTASWSLGPLVEALRGLRGIDLLSAATFVATTGDLSRFESPRLLMGYLGLVPSEHSSGAHIRRGGITKTGNREARRMLIEAAWSYRYPARVAKDKAEILVRLPKSVRDIAWKAQTRLCARYRTMIAKGKKSDGCGSSARTRARRLRMGHRPGNETQRDCIATDLFSPLGWGTGQPVMVILVSSLGRTTVRRPL